MHITLSPQRRNVALILSKLGDILTLNGEIFDLSPLPEGATLPAEAIHSDWFAGDVSRIDGALTLTLVVPHGQNAPRDTRFPKPISVTKDGPIDLPAYDVQTKAEPAV